MKTTNEVTPPIPENGGPRSAMRADRHGGDGWERYDSLLFAQGLRGMDPKHAKERPDRNGGDAALRASGER
jgi:hypothetical protein